MHDNSCDADERAVGFARRSAGVIRNVCFAELATCHEQWVTLLLLGGDKPTHLVQVGSSAALHRAQLSSGCIAVLEQG